MTARPTCGTRRAGAEQLARRHRGGGAGLDRETFGDDCIVASNMQDAVLVDLAAKAKPGVDVLFLDTGYHFAETIGTRDAVEHGLRRADRQRAGRSRPSPSRTPSAGKDLFARDPDQCCALRKVVPLQKHARRLRGVGHRRAPGRGADPGEHPARHVRREVGLVKINPIAPGPTRRWTPTSPSTASW